jgi:hypothetical protein
VRHRRGAQLLLRDSHHPAIIVFMYIDLVRTTPKMLTKFSDVELELHYCKRAGAAVRCGSGSSLDGPGLITDVQDG